MKESGAKLVLKSVRAIEDGSAKFVTQDHSLASPAPKIHPENCEINFLESLTDIHNFIRGMSPYPGAWTIVDGKKLKVLSATKVLTLSKLSGFVTNEKNFLRYYKSDGYIEILKVQLEGKRSMEVNDFLNGFSSDSFKKLIS